MKSDDLISGCPAEVCEMKEEMDERSARRNHKTGCHDGPQRSFR